MCTCNCQRKEIKKENSIKRFKTIEHGKRKGYVFQEQFLTQPKFQLPNRRYKFKLQCSSHQIFQLSHENIE